jgi:hypothetical protein
LQSTYLELVDMQSHNQLGALNEDGGAATRLKSAVDVARSVERKLRGDDSEGQARRNKYLQAYEDSTGIASSDKITNGNLDFNPLAQNQDQSREEQQ